MKSFSPALLAALEAGDVITAGAVKITTADPFRVWTGYGDISVEGEPFKGIGATGLIKATASQLGGAEQALELVLSSVDPDVLPLIEAADANKAPVIVWRLFFDGSGANLLGAHRFAMGRVDTLPTEEVPGGTASARCNVETAARGLGRSTGRTRSDSDQRRVEGTDGGFKWVSQAPARQLAWGGKPPSRADNTLPNTGGPFVQLFNRFYGGADLA